MRSVDQRIDDILGAIQRCERYAGSLTSADALIAEMAEYAVERNLQIIGEAVNQLPAAVTGSSPEVPWAQIRGFRNILVHQYFGVEASIVQDVVRTHLPELARALVRQKRWH